MDEKGKMEEKVKVDDLFEGTRRFELEDSVTGETKGYLLELPTSEEVKLSQWEYTKAFNKAMKEEVLTEGEMLDMLKKRGIIGDDFDTKINELQLQLEDKYTELEMSSGKEEKRFIALEITSIREQIFALNSRYSGPMTNTCEGLAKDVRNDFLTVCCTKTLDGKRVWENLQEYVDEKDRNLSMKAKFEVMMWMEGIDPDFLDKTPENQVLKEMQEEYENKLAEDEKASEEASAKEEEDSSGVAKEEKQADDPKESKKDTSAKEAKPSKKKKKAGRPKKKDNK